MSRSQLPPPTSSPFCTNHPELRSTVSGVRSSLEDSGALWLREQLSPPDELPGVHVCGLGGGAPGALRLCPRTLQEGGCCPRLQAWFWGKMPDKSQVLGRWVWLHRAQKTHNHCSGLCWRLPDNEPGDRYSPALCNSAGTARAPHMQTLGTQDGLRSQCLWSAE